MQKIIPKLNAEWQMIAPKREPEYLLRVENNILTRNILNIQIKAGTVKKCHLLLIKTNPK